MREYQNFATSLQFRYIANFSLDNEIHHHSEMPALCFWCSSDSVLVFLLSTLIVIVLVRLVW